MAKSDRDALFDALAEIRKLKRKNAKLRRENKRLQAELIKAADLLCQSK